MLENGAARNRKELDEAREHSQGASSVAAHDACSHVVEFTTKREIHLVGRFFLGSLSLVVDHFPYSDADETPLPISSEFLRFSLLPSVPYFVLQDKRRLIFVLSTWP